MKIAIDLDETIFDCRSILYRVANAVLPPSGDNTMLKYDVIRKEDKHSKSVLAKISKIFNKNAYNEIENATDIIKKWDMAGYEIVLLSNRPAWKALKNMLLSWLENFDVPFTMLVVACNNKAKFCKAHKIEILVDDSPCNCMSAETEGIFAVYYNNHLDSGVPAMCGSKLAIASNWEEINEYVVNYIRDYNKAQISEKLKRLEALK